MHGAIALAEAFWPGPLTLVLPKTSRLRGGRSRHRRARHRRDPGSRPPGRAGHPARVRRAGGGAVGQSVGPCLADHGGACAKRPRGADRPDRRWRRRSRSASNPPSSAASNAPMLLRPGGLPRGEIERVLGRPLARPPEDADRGDRPAAGAGHAGLALRAAHAGAARCRAASTPARRCWRSARDAVPGADARGRRDEFVRARRSRRRPPPIFSAIFAPSTPEARAAIAVMPVPHHGLGEAINDRLRRAAMAASNDRDNAKQKPEP